MKKIILYTFLLMVGLHANAQNVPNGSFEDWETGLLFEEPQLWNTNNREGLFTRVINAQKTTDNYSGSYALFLESSQFDGENIFGYALCNAIVSDNTQMDTIFFEGGFPLTSTPDSVFGYFKYTIAENDSALMLVSFKKDGRIINQNIIFIGGNQNDFIKIGFNLHDFPETPDTATIGFAATNPENPFAGNSLFVDSLWFSGNDSIPNADFENWNSLTFKDPVSWMSSNVLQAFAGQDESATQTPEAHSGDWAIRIESKKTLVPNNYQIDTITFGFLLNRRPNTAFGENSFFNIDFNPGELQGYYKFIPVENDTAQIMIEYYDSDGTEYFDYTILPAADQYTQFHIPLHYPINVSIDSISIIVLTTIKTDMFMNYFGEDGTVLYLDDLVLTNPCEGFPEFSIENISQDPCTTQTLSAGNDWDEYLWSTGEITPAIEIENPDDYSVIVTDNATGCHLTDTIFAYVIICDDISEKVLSNSVKLFPNPATDLLSLNLQDVSPGIYNIEITSLEGSLLKNFSRTVLNSDESFSIALDNLAPGLYFIKIKGSDFYYLEKLIIE